MKKALDEEYKNKKKKDEKTNVDMAGVFLTPKQKAIVECNHPFLQIVGPPGTGKTYCLIMKMVNVFFELWQLNREQNKKINELIIVFHENENTLRFIRDTFWKTTKIQIERKNENKIDEIPKLIIFIGGSNVMDIDTKYLFQVEEYDFTTRFKVFYDDASIVPVFEEYRKDLKKNRMFEILKAIDRSNFCWCTSYSDFLPLANFYRPLSCLTVNGNKIFDSSYYVHLTDSLRYTGNIHSLLKQLYATRINASLVDRGARNSGINFNPGTRVIGEKPQFVCLKDCNSMKFEVQELLKKLYKEGFQKDEITVITTRVFTQSQIIKDVLKKDVRW
jgi:hypothetical protein